MRNYCYTFIAVFFFACSGEDMDAAVNAEDQIIEAWLDSMNITATRDESGLYFFPVVSNDTGTSVTTGSVAGIYYTLRNLDGNILASHQRTDGDSLLLQQGTSSVFPVGLDIGLSRMKMGETFSFIIPSSLGYGQVTPGGDVEPETIVILETEVVHVTSEEVITSQHRAEIDSFLTNVVFADSVPAQTLPSGLVYKRIRRGIDSLQLAMTGDTILINYDAGFLQDTSLVSFQNVSGFSMVVGSEGLRPLLPPFEEALSLMRPGEQGIALLPASIAYKASVLVVPSSITADLIQQRIIPDYSLPVLPYQLITFTITRIE